MVFEVSKEFDIRAVSFEEFVDFLFHHEVPPEFTRNGKRSKAWYHNAEVECIPEDVVSHYTNLFSDPAFLLDRFSRHQLEQGFWMIMGQFPQHAVGEVIWDENVKFVDRANCVRAMFHLYEKFFAIDFLVTSGEMWWDALAYDWHCDNRNRASGGEDLLMQDVMFETLERILGLTSENCQAAALHGLGHLHHPSTTTLVHGYLARNKSIPDELKDYALAAARFEVL